MIYVGRDVFATEKKVFLVPGLLTRLQMLGLLYNCEKELVRHNQINCALL